MIKEVIMTNIIVSIVNKCTVLTDKQLAGLTPALQKQVSRDFAPAWGVDALLVFVPKGHNPAPGTWVINITDNSDQAGALGYHYLTTDGLPSGYAFVKTDIVNGYSWSVTISHELLEMLIDPYVNLAALVSLPNQKTRLYAYEVCDPCEEDNLGYTIDGYLVSDFVLPTWFETFRKAGSTKFDFQNKITKPLQILTGGYMSILDINSSSGWKSLSETGVVKSANKVKGSRQERRNFYLNAAPTELPISIKPIIEKLQNKTLEETNDSKLSNNDKLSMIKEKITNFFNFKK